MSKKITPKETPVKVTVLKTIHDAMLPAYYRLGSLCRDVLSGTYPLSDAETAVLLDATSCAITLKAIFEEYLLQAEESEVDVLYLPNTEFKSVLTMSKVVEASQRANYGQTGIWSH